MYTITDPIFGKLTRENSVWNGNLWIDFLQQDVEVELPYRDENSPTEQEQRAFAVFKEQLEAIFQGMELALHQYCLSEQQRYKDDWDAEDFNLEVPNQVWDLLEILRISVADYSPEKMLVAVRFDFACDVEHGLDVEIDVFDQIMGIAEGGAHWFDQHHYDFAGQEIRLNHVL